VVSSFGQTSPLLGIWVKYLECSKQFTVLKNIVYRPTDESTKFDYLLQTISRVLMVFFHSSYGLLGQRSRSHFCNIVCDRKLSLSCSLFYFI